MASLLYGDVSVMYVVTGGYFVSAFCPLSPLIGASHGRNVFITEMLYL